jgi:hypothetical protein
MNYFILLSIFPQDIVYYIVQIIKQTNSKNIIYKYYQNTKQKIESIKYISIMITLVNHSGFLNNEILTNKLPTSLTIIYNSNYNREKYNNNFWIAFTDLLSKKLMVLNNHILINHKNKKNDTQYIILNNSIRLWFKICVKHNIRLLLSFSKVEHYDYCFSRQIKEIKNFLKFLYTPRSVDNNNLFLNDDYSRFIIENTTNLVL